MNILAKKELLTLKYSKKARERMDDPNIITGKEGVYCLFEMMGIPIEWDEIFKDE